eukprot:gnl/TRDRNA2_/TRDRNA2_191209_c0_seq1.p1 gnl/TRDRNA2_/TRDRNA2_191209_c0~~gnl/TRDRNA2_/TRDRNA2_191209_c0_seq1.p1  ORF type:complete len:239 (+),score=11.17 gnl/TRDRNA2_/TRDRNA2_191209_c0_seq1:101-718(+)
MGFHGEADQSRDNEYHEDMVLDELRYAADGNGRRDIQDSYDYDDVGLLQLKLLNLSSARSTSWRKSSLHQHETEAKFSTIESTHEPRNMSLTATVPAASSLNSQLSTQVALRPHAEQETQASVHEAVGTPNGDKKDEKPAMFGSSKLSLKLSKGYYPFVMLYMNTIMFTHRVCESLGRGIVQLLPYIVYFSPLPTGLLAKLLAVQ